MMYYFYTATLVAPKETLICCCRYLKRKPPKQGKPPILPPSKKRLYQFYQSKWMPPEHVYELLWRRHVYNHAFMSIRRIFREEVEQNEGNFGILAEVKRKEKEELENLIAENDEANRRKANERTAREKQEMEELRIKTLEEVEKKLAAEEADIENRSKEVLEMIERSKEFLTPENIDEKIANALDNPVVYDFFLDLRGIKYYSPKPVKYLEGIPTRQKGRFYDLVKVPKETKIASSQN